MNFRKCKILVSGIIVLTVLMLIQNIAMANEDIYFTKIGLTLDFSGYYPYDMYGRKNSISNLSGIKGIMKVERIYDKALFSWIQFNETVVNKAVEANKDLSYYVFYNYGVGDIFIYKSDRNSYTDLQKTLSTMLDTPEFIFKSIQQHSNPDSQILAEYKKYYDIDPYTFEIKYKKPSKEEVSKLSKNNKEKYKKIKNIQKYIEERRYFKALEIDKDYLPIYIYMYNNAIENKLCGNAMFALQKFEEINKIEPIFNEDIINYQLGLINYIFDNQEKALSYLKKYTFYSAQTDNQYLAWLLAFYNQQKGNYSTAIFYANQVQSTSMFKNDSYVLIYECYKKLNNKQKVKEYLEKLVQINPTSDYYDELATFYPTEKAKQTIYKKARNTLYSETFNDKIIKYEQAKITNATKAFNGYYEKPDWNNYVTYFSRYYNSSQVYEYQDLFYDSTNICIAKYKGQNLKYCFDGVKKKFDKITDDVNKQYYSKIEYDQQKMLHDDVISSQKYMIDDLKKEIEELRRKLP